MCIWFLKTSNSTGLGSAVDPHQEEETHTEPAYLMARNLNSLSLRNAETLRDSGSFPKKRVSETIVLAF